MKRVLALIPVLLYAGLHLGCTCDCDVCTEYADAKHCATIPDVKKEECTEDGRCADAEFDLKCTVECR
jgi:hypothetical protein